MTIETPQFTTDGRAINAAAVHHQVNQARRTRMEAETREAQLALFPAPAGRLRIVSAAHGVMTHKQWSLPPIAPEAVSTALGIRPNGGHSYDGKVSTEWEFLADGQPCAIWDYRGARWSAYGPREVFEALGLLPAEA